MPGIKSKRQDPDRQRMRIQTYSRVMVNTTMYGNADIYLTCR